MLRGAWSWMNGPPTIWKPASPTPESARASSSTAYERIARARPASAAAAHHASRPAPTTRNGGVAWMMLPKTTPATENPTTNADCSSPKYIDVCDVPASSCERLMNESNAPYAPGMMPRST